MAFRRGAGGGRRVAASAVAALILAAGGCGAGGGGAAPDPSLPVGTEVGEQFPELRGERVGGGGWELERGRTQAVVFLRGLHCGLCRERLRELRANHGDYVSAGVRVVVVTPRDTSDAASAARELDLPFPVVEADSATFARWGLIDEATGLTRPASYLLDRRGVIVYRHVGRHAGDRARDIELLATLQQADAGR
jgi:peroxiredoxin